MRYNVRDFLMDFILSLVHLFSFSFLDTDNKYQKDLDFSGWIIAFLLISIIII